MRVLDGAVAVFCGVAGVQPQSETVWRQATKYRVPRIAFVNKMDRTGRILRMRSVTCARSSGLRLSYLLPIGKEDYFRGVIDLVNQKAIIYDDNDEVGLKYRRSTSRGPQRIRQAALAELIDASLTKTTRLLS